jgi:hypothetical protein
VSRFLTLSTLLALAICAGALATYEHCPGCIDRSRTNKTCDWTDDTSFSVDYNNASHQAHLVADAQLAEELAIRYADAEFGRRFGVEHHGGLLDGGTFRRECLSRLFDAIENNHGVTSAQVQFARGQRNGSFDFAVALLFLPFYSLGAFVASRWLFTRFSSEGRFVALVATVMVSIAVSVLGLQSLRLWSAVWETIRVGNGHMSSMRAASYTRWNHQYPGAEFIAGILLFWLIAFWCYRVLSHKPTRDPIAALRYE